jgi:hypothetical protein
MKFTASALLLLTASIPSVAAGARGAPRNKVDQEQNRRALDEPEHNHTIDVSIRVLYTLFSSTILLLTHQYVVVV